MDALVFEFMGLAMLALCVIVLAVPSAGAVGARASTDRSGTIASGRPNRRKRAAACEGSIASIPSMQGSNLPQDP